MRAEIYFTEILMGLLDGLADKIRENADRKFYEQWSSPSYRKSQYEEFKRLHSDKNAEELRELLMEFPIVMPKEYWGECREYFGFNQTPSLSDEIEQHRMAGDLFETLRDWDLLEEEKFSKAWVLLTVKEQEEYKLRDDVWTELVKCRNERSDAERSSHPVDTATRYENIYRLLQSYETEEKTAELKMALNLMKDDEKEAYKAKKAASASAPKATPQQQVPIPQKPVAATPSPAHAVQASAPVAQAPASAEDELEAKLSKLKNLFDKGLISQEDFDKKKSDLLMNL